MAIKQIVTAGYGSFGTIANVVRRGYSAEAGVNLGGVRFEGTTVYAGQFEKTVVHEPSETYEVHVPGFEKEHSE